MAINQFPRRPIERPHTNILTDTSAITGASSGSDKLVMLVGSAKGGQPNTVYRVRNYIQAKQIFREGDLVDAMELAWNPSGESPGAGDILAMRIEDASNATLEQGNVTFESRLFGEQANEIRVNLPVGLIRALSSSGLVVSGPLGNNDALKDIDWEKILQLVENGTEGKIVEIESADGDIVEIVVE